jgi:enediyne biosynthesis protein E4
VGDFNADGWDDVFITAGMCFPFRYGINSLLLNNRGERFLDAEFLLGVEPRRAGKTAMPWFDVDCATEGAGRPVCRDQSGPVTVSGSMGSRSSVALDIDGDGDLDIVTNEFGGVPQVLVSNLAQRKTIRYLKVRLIGTASNRDGLGATVRVWAGNRVFTKYNDGKSGYLSQSSQPLYFGLGDARSVDRIEVLWPSGKKSLLERVSEINRTLEITEPR